MVVTIFPLFLCPLSPSLTPIGSGPHEAPAAAQRAGSGGDENKMENQLEINKANKPTLDSSEDVAGRKEKGTGTKILEKVTGKAENKGKDEDGEGKGSGKWL
jgi:hypothetical protein